MKHVDDYRDAETCRRLVECIHQVASRSHTLMEVCGGQTHGLVRHGIASALQGAVELIHGPGCPVCVTPAKDIDHAIALSHEPGVLVTTFGDMLRVPGTRDSLRDAMAAGGSVRMVYSPLDAVKLAREHPQQQVVFFAVGFETTTPATALAVQQARALQLTNFSLLVSHVRVQPAMEMILADPGCRVTGFLAAGHVCAVDGFARYEPLVARYRIPIVVAGFEPVDLLDAILACVQQLESGSARLENRYARTVSLQGNTAAQDLINQTYEIGDRAWRGLGTLPAGGYRLREELRDWDARERFSDRLATTSDLDSPRSEEDACPSHEVLLGRLRPTDCPHFGTRCTPEHPLGAPMVSSEGACAAYVSISPSRPAT